MLRLSKKTDYALLALQYLASKAPSGVASARAIAERFDIPLELLAKVLQQLAHHRLVAAHKGMHGGYHLARPSRAISVADVVHAIDGPVTFTDVRQATPNAISSQLALFAILSGGSRQRILSVLQAVTLADMAEGDEGGSLLMVSKAEPGTGVPVQGR
jgi:Rrf2 family protein